MTTLRLTLLLTLSLLLAACQWNIGAIIRSDTAVFVGADVRKPVDGKVYCAKNCQWYAWVPEVTYRTEPEVVECCAMGPTPRRVRDIRPTGRIILVRIDLLGSEKVESLPEGGRFFCLSRGEWPSVSWWMDIKNDEQPGDQSEDRSSDWADLFRENDHRWLGDFGGDGVTRGSLGAQVAAAPFDYGVDPALSVATSPFWLLGMLFYAAITGH